MSTLTLHNFPSKPKPPPHGRSYIAGGFYFHDDFHRLTYYIRRGWVPYSEAKEREGRAPSRLDMLDYKGPAVFYAYFDPKTGSVFALNFLDKLANEIVLEEKPNAAGFKEMIRKFQPFTVEEARLFTPEECNLGLCDDHEDKSQTTCVTVDTAQPADFVMRPTLSPSASEATLTEIDAATPTKAQDFTVTSSKLQKIYGMEAHQTSVDDLCSSATSETGYESDVSDASKCGSPPLRHVYTPQKVSLLASHSKMRSEDFCSSILESISEDPSDEEHVKRPASSRSGTSSRTFKSIRSLRWIKFFSAKS